MNDFYRLHIKNIILVSSKLLSLLSKTKTIDILLLPYMYFYFMQTGRYIIFRNENFYNCSRALSVFFTPTFAE